MEDKESLDVRHKKEKKDLQGKIQNLKKSATKGDKKKKKEVTEEIALLEQELKKKHDEELAQFKEPEDSSATEHEVAEAMESVTIHSNFKEVPLKMSKAQKRRDKKAQQEREREKEIAVQEKLNIHGARNVEIQKIKATLKGRNLMVHEIPSDGNCLYCAVDHQLTEVGDHSLGLQRLRALTSEFLSSHIQDFLPFMSHPETGDLFSEDQYQEYCDKVASTPAWGGEIELRALSHVLRRRIEVVQAEGPTVVLGEEYPESSTLTLAFHRHMFGLGEHYNSVKKYKESEDSEVELGAVEVPT